VIKKSRSASDEIPPGTGAKRAKAGRKGTDSVLQRAMKPGGRHAAASCPARPHPALLQRPSDFAGRWCNKMSSTLAEPDFLTL
jgi:hypothetical protein